MPGSQDPRATCIFKLPHLELILLLLSHKPSIWFPLQQLILTSLVAQTVKRLPTTWETQVRSLGQEDLLEKEMATHSSTLAWKIPWTEEPVRLQSMESQRAGHNWATSMSMSTTNLSQCKLLLAYVHVCKIWLETSLKVGFFFLIFYSLFV